MSEDLFFTSTSDISSDSNVISRYFIRKHTWHGKSVREMLITRTYVLVISPGSSNPPHKYDYGSFSILPVTKSSDEFQLSFERDKTVFSSPYRASLLADISRAAHSSKASISRGISVSELGGGSWTGEGLRRSGERRPCVLEVRPWGIEQQHSGTGAVVACYDYTAIEKIVTMTDLAGGFVIRMKACGSGAKQRHAFVVPERSRLLASASSCALRHLGLVVPVSDGGEPEGTRAGFDRIRRDEETEAGTEGVLAEYNVQKVNPARHTDPAPRILVLGTRHVTERRPDTYGIATLRSFSEIDHLVRPPSDPQALIVVYRDGHSARYTSVQRDALLCALLDCARAAGSGDAFVVSERVGRGSRVVPAGVGLDAATEGQILKTLATYKKDDHAEEKDGGAAFFASLVDTFNANVPYSGTQNNDTKTQQKNVVASLLNVSNYSQQPPSLPTLHAIKRLVAVRAAFEAFSDNAPLREKLLEVLSSALWGNTTGASATRAVQMDEVATYAALEVLDALMIPQFKLDSPTTDATNKTLILQHKRTVDGIFSLLFHHVKRGTSPLIVLGCVDFLTTAICPPYGDTTPADLHANLLRRVADLGRDFFKLFHQVNCLSVVRGAGMIMKCLIEEGGDIEGLVPKMQRCALVEGATLRHLYEAFFASPTVDSSTGKKSGGSAGRSSRGGNSTHRKALFQDLSRQLVSLWISGCPEAEEMLSRVLPPALVYYLESKEEPPPEETEGELDEGDGKKGKGGLSLHSLLDQWRKPTFPKRPPAELRAKKISWKGSEKNWPMLFYQFKRDHRRADLIWDNHTRQELCDCLENELRVFAQEQELSLSTTQITDRSKGMKTAPKIPPRSKKPPVPKRKKDLSLDDNDDGAKEPEKDKPTPTEGEEKTDGKEDTKKKTSGGLAPEAPPPTFISWNHSEFIVPYVCLDREVCIDGYYLRYLLNPQPGPNGEPPAKAPPLRDPPEFFDMLFHRCLLERDEELQALCIQALGVVYKYYEKDIGPFRDIPHLLALLRQATDFTVRDRLLQLFLVLLKRKENAKLFVDHGGVQLLVDMLTLVHFSCNHIITPLKGNLLTASDMQAEGEWFYTVITEEKIEAHMTEDGRQEPARVETKKEKVGPKNIAEMEKLYDQGAITPSTLCWAQGMEDWRRLGDVIQLRWRLMAKGKGVLSAEDLTLLVLQILTQLCELYPMRDADGGVIRPLPRPKRQLSEQLLLPHVVQTLLTFNPNIVDAAARLLALLFSDNAAAAPQAFLTGFFYFVFLYSGSNVLSLLDIVKRLHMVQHHFREDSAGNDIAARSILGPLLPPAMIHMIERRTPEEFTSVFIGNNDTPEAIWNAEMRTLLIDRLASHVGSFLQRLEQNPKAIYQYVPIAPIIYQQITPELFCSHYYLRNFCNTQRFPNWPVDNVVEFLQSLLALWAKLSAEDAAKNPTTAASASTPSKPKTATGGYAGVDDDDDDYGAEPEEERAPRLSVLEACNILGVLPAYTDDELRRAYFKLAKKYHPDRNPEGKAMFQKVNAAYDLLASHEDPDIAWKRELLVVRAQSILYTRFRKELAPFRYAGYPILCSTFQAALSRSDEEGREMLAACAELCLGTLRSTSLSADELCRQGGLDILNSVLLRVLPQIYPDTKSTDLTAHICADCLFSLATAASYDQCRQRIATLDGMTRTVVSCERISHLPRLVESALECICCFSLSPEMAESLLDLGAIYPAVPLLFGYDHTLVEAGVTAASDTEDPDAVSAEMKNTLAQLALMALSRLGGLDPACAGPDVCDARKNCVTALLSKGIAAMCSEARPVAEILKILTTNVETPLLLWNAYCRAELLAFVDEETHRLKGGSGGEFDRERCAKFVFKTLARELLVGGVYVRIFNSLPPAAQAAALPNCAPFARKLVDYLAKSVAGYNKIDMTLPHLRELRAKYREMVTSTSPDKLPEEAKFYANVEGGLTKVAMATEALSHLLQVFRGLETQLLSRPDVRTLFSLIGLSASEKAQLFALSALTAATKTAEYVDAVAAAHPLAFFGPAICSDNEDVVCSACTALASLLGSSPIVSDALTAGTPLHLLRVYASETPRGRDPKPRVLAAAALVRMCSDRVSGSRVRVVLTRFLPGAFITTMCNDTAAAVSQVDSIHENPELIWTPSTLAQLRTTTAALSDVLLDRQRHDPDAPWGLSDDYRVEYDELRGEIQIGGVYVRLFLKNPGYVLRAPKTFLEDLLTRFVEAYQQAARHQAMVPSPEETMETIHKAVACLVATAPSLADHAAVTGHLAKITGLIASPQLPKQPAGTGVLAVLLTSELCVERLCATQGAAKALCAAAAAPGCLSSAAEALDRAFATSGAVCQRTGGACCLAKQLLESKCIDALLSTLDSAKGAGSQEAENRARIVTALKNAAEDAVHGQAVSDELDKNPIWAMYKTQRHDLFLPSQQSVGLLTGPGTGPSGSIGLLTNSPSTAQAMSDAPPELL